MLTDPILKSKVDALWDKFWSGGIANPITAIEQMSYLIFLKRLEDMDNARSAAARRRVGRSDTSSSNERTDSSLYKSIFKGNEECRWSYWSQLTD
ncbi:MAG: type I restriction-modification system subunit M N-terminal domain-containing protein [Bacteroidota bacterium]|nr:type I restriction-modification system subunit M N-terminal domain-containing protein [Bacteroidota bacterium]